MKLFKYLFVNTHPDRMFDSTTFAIHAESREVADDCINLKLTPYVHLLNVTEEEAGDVPGMTRQSRNMK